MAMSTVKLKGSNYIRIHVFFPTNLPNSFKVKDVALSHFLFTLKVVFLLPSLLRLYPAQRQASV